MAGGIGAVLHDVEHHPDLVVRVLLTGGLGMYVCTSLVLALASQRSWQIWLRPLAILLVLAGVLVFGGELSGPVTLWIMVACVALLASAPRPSEPARA